MDLTSNPVIYNKAPIIEAIIDVRFGASPGISPDLLASRGQAIQETYPTQVNLVNLNTQVTLQGANGMATEASQTVVGLMWMSSDQRSNVQVRTDGFTFRRFAPYTTWEEFAGEAKKLWALFVPATPDRRLSRVAVRYVNRLNLPMPIADFSEYLNTFPVVPLGLPQSLRQLFMQFTIGFDDLQATALITESIIPPVEPSTCAMILDIDVARDSDVPQTDEELWTYLERLRECKNLIFDQCTTEKTKGLIR